MSEFTPIIGARYRVTDRTGRSAVLFVNGPPFKDCMGTSFVLCQTEELDEEPVAPTSPQPVIIAALSWVPLSLAGQ